VTAVPVDENGQPRGAQWIAVHILVETWPWSLSMGQRCAGCALPSGLGVSLGGTCLALYGDALAVPAGQSCTLTCLDESMVAAVGAPSSVLSCSANGVPALAPPGPLLICVPKGMLCFYWPCSAPMGSLPTLHPPCPSR
jgi:hypothetical protein